MIKMELYKDGDLVLSTDGKIDDRLLVFGNIIYDLDKDVLIREDASFRYLLDFKNSTSEIIIKEQDYHLNLKIDVISVNNENKRREIYYNIESETQINNRIVLTFD